MKQAMDGDPYRANVRAGAAEAGSVRKRVSLLEPEHGRCKNRADGSGVDPAIRVTAGLTIHGAYVQAGAASHAPQCLPGVLVRQYIRASVVDENHVELLWALCFGACPGRGSLEDGDIASHRLSGRCSCRELEESGEITPAGQDLLDAHERDMNGRKGRREADIPFVLHHG